MQLLHAGGARAEQKSCTDRPRDCYNAGMKVTDRIKAAVEEARRKGDHPRKVFLTVDEGRQLQFELIDQGGRVGQKVMREGIRRAIHKIEGVEVVWRSPEFRVS